MVIHFVGRPDNMTINLPRKLLLCLNLWYRQQQCSQRVNWCRKMDTQAISLPWNNYIARKMGQQTVRLQNHRLKIGVTQCWKISPKSSKRKCLNFVKNSDETFFGYFRTLWQYSKAPQLFYLNR